MKKITINNFQYIDCTAIATSAGDCGEENRQPAVLIRSLEAAPGDADGILFGWSVADLDSDDVEVQIQGEPVSFDDDDLATVLLDGHPLNELCSGEL